MLHLPGAFRLRCFLPPDDGVADVDRRVKVFVQKLPYLVVAVCHSASTREHAAVDTRPHIIGVEVSAAGTRPLSIPRIYRVILVARLQINGRLLWFHCQVFIDPVPWVGFARTVAGLE